MATVEELENRVRELAGDVEGEKAVTRQVYMQAIRNGDQIGALRTEVVALTSQVDHIVQEVVQNTALLRSQGGRLESLTRDVTLLRNDATLLRRDVEAVNQRLDGLCTRLDQIQGSIAAILAAVAPPRPPA